MEEKKSNKGHKGFQPGHPPIKGCGRPVGSRSGNTIMKDLLRGFTVDKYEYFEAAMEWLFKNDPKAYCGYYIKIIEFYIPKLQSIALNETEQSSSAMDRLREIASQWSQKKQDAD